MHSSGHLVRSPLYERLEWDSGWFRCVTWGVGRTFCTNSLSAIDNDKSASFNSSLFFHSCAGKCGARFSDTSGFYSSPRQKALNSYRPQLLAKDQTLLPQLHKPCLHILPWLWFARQRAQLGLKLCLQFLLGRRMWSEVGSCWYGASSFRCVQKFCWPQIGF